MFIFFIIFHVETISAQDVQKNMDKINVKEEFQSLNNDMSSAQSHQVEVLSPHNFKVANFYLEKARANLDKQDVLKNEIHRQILTARNYLSQANSTANLYHKEMDDVVIARQQALNAGAQVFFTDDFQKADEQMVKISADLENKNTTNAQKNRASLKNTYSALELRSVRHQNLAQAGLTVLQAVKDGAKVYAPEKLKLVLNNYREATNYINQHPHNTDEIKSRSLVVSDGAKELLQTTHDIAEVKKNSREVIVGVEDVISTRQSSVMPKVATDKMKDLEKQFSSNEADIYRQGNTIVMRLKGLQFPASKALLKDSDLRLLGKVQRAIKKLKTNEVVIEGHTDNIGDKEINQKISRVRAQMIKDYLLSVDAVASNKVKVVGRGEEMPLESNETAEGRAQNRRVDIYLKL